MGRAAWSAAVAAALAAAAVVAIRDARRPFQVTGDSRVYAAMAENLRASRTIGRERVAPAADRAPGYPVLLALAGPPSWERARAVQAALLWLCAVLAAALAWSLHSSAAAVLAALLTVFGPLREAAGMIGVEPLFAAAVLGAAWALAARRGEAVAIGLTFWIRSTLLPLPPLLAVARRSWLPLLAYAVIAPWTLRNAARLGAVIPVERQAGVYNLFQAAHGAVDGVDDVESDALARETIADWDRLDYAQKETALYSASLAAVAADPLRYAVGCLRRLWALWAGCWWLVVAAGLGAWRLRDRPEIRAAAAVAAFWNVHALMAVTQRYAAPAAPLLGVLAACGAADLLVRGEPGPALRRLVPAALAIPGALAAASTVAVLLERTPGRRADPALCPAASSRWFGLADAKRAVDRGVILSGAGDWERGARCFEAALIVEPRYEPARESLAAARVALTKKEGDPKLRAWTRPR